VGKVRAAEVGKVVVKVVDEVAAKSVHLGKVKD